MLAAKADLPTPGAPLNPNHILAVGALDHSFDLL